MALEDSGIRSFYTPAKQRESAGDIFQDAMSKFSSELSNDPEKLKWIVEQNYINVDSIITTVEETRALYEGRKGESSVRDALSSVAEKIHHYGGIMDVIVSHHPEYTALFWGATKFLIVGAVSHQKTITRLSDGLVHIANLRKIIEAIYAYIIKFLIRALRWYQEGRLKHIVHSITRPTEIRYDDILNTIAALSRSMSDVAATSGQAEQRDIHLEILKQTKKQEALQASLSSQKAVIHQILADVRSIRSEWHEAFPGLQHMITSGQDGIKNQLTAILLEVMTIKSNMGAFRATANVVLHHQLSTLQVSAILTRISVAKLRDHPAAYQMSGFLARKRRDRPSAQGPPFWLEDKVQQWNSCTPRSV